MGLREQLKQVPGLRRGYTFARHAGANMHPGSWAGGGWPSYAQHGEDMLARVLLAGLGGPQAFVDVGARHPVQDSNTYYFYRQGWRGLNIDAMPGSMQLFDYLRPGDMNVESCVGPAHSEPIDFYIYESSGFNTASRDRVEELRRERPELKLQRVERMPIRPLRDLIREHLPSGGRDVVLMSVDAESYDEAVLDSNDWDVCRPYLVMFEANGVGFEQLAADPVVVKMQSRGYELAGLAGPTVLMRLRA